MPTKRRPLKRETRRRVTPAAVEAYKARDYMRLHLALGLMPWQPSPLPLEVEGLGVDQGPPPEWVRSYPERVADWELAQRLQRELEVESA